MTDKQYLRYWQDELNRAKSRATKCMKDYTDFKRGQWAYMYRHGEPSPLWKSGREQVLYSAWLNAESDVCRLSMKLENVKQLIVRRGSDFYE